MKAFIHKYDRKEILLGALDMKLDELINRCYGALVFEVRHTKQLQEIGRMYRDTTGGVPPARLRPY